MTTRRKRHLHRTTTPVVHRLDAGVLRATGHCRCGMIIVVEEPPAVEGKDTQKRRLFKRLHRDFADHNLPVERGPNGEEPMSETFRLSIRQEVKRNGEPWRIVGREYIVIEGRPGLWPAYKLERTDAHGKVSTLKNVPQDELVLNIFPQEGERWP